MINFEKELNKQQQEVVFHGDGPCLVLSGPGSGKTRTLVYRTAYLLQKKIPPEQILLLTFTKKAASEMINRIHKLSYQKSQKIYGGTFHHIGNLFLKEYSKEIGYNKNYTIIDEEDSKNIIKIITKQEIARKFLKPQIIQKIISLSVNSQQSIDDIINVYFQQIEEEYIEDIKKIAKKYHTRKKNNNIMDYDDLLSNFLKILNIKNIQVKISQKFLYVLVDEYQDTNTIQEKIIKKISTHNNILAVGDESQSIYSFRAANINNIINFTKNYKNAKIFKIENNYRSTKEILDMANCLIENNTERLEKTLRSTLGSGITPSILSFWGPQEQARFIADYLEKSNKPSEAVVLFRAHFHAVELELELAKRKMPYVLQGGIKFFDQFHIKDAIAFLKIISNSTDESSWRRLLLRQEKVGEATAEKIITEILKEKTLENIIIKKEEFIKKFSSSIHNGLRLVFNSLEKAMNKDASDKIDIFFNDLYEEYLKFSFDNFQKRKNDILKLKELTLNYETEEEMLSNFSLSEEVEINKDSTKKVVLSTIHQAKGLEWESVFIINLNEGNFPHFKSLEEGMIEEERRLFYVAITRCKKNLFITYTKNDRRRGGPLSPSRFISEIEGNRKIRDEEIINNNNDDGWEFF